MVEGARGCWLCARSTGQPWVALAPWEATGHTAGRSSACLRTESCRLPALRVRVCCAVSENLAKLFSLMDPSSPERVAFVSRALKWSSGGSGKLGHPRLHQLLALTLWKGKPAVGGLGGL